MKGLVKTRWNRVNASLAEMGRYFLQSPVAMFQHKAMKRLLSRYLERTVLDVGAGRSVYRNLVPGQVRYIALDYGETKTKYANRSAVALVGDAQQLPVASGSCDSVLCTEVLEHLPTPWEAARELGRILKPGGHAVISVPFLGYYHNEPWDYYRFTRYGLRELFRDEAYEIVHEEGVGGLFAYLGHIRSTILLSVGFGIPILWSIMFWFNVALSYIDIAMDRLTKTSSIMPVTNIIVVRKRALIE